MEKQTLQSLAVLPRSCVLYAVLAFAVLIGTDGLLPAPAAAQKKPKTTPVQKANAAPLRLLSCIGKGFPEYAKVLGPPASVKKDTNNDGENRIYVSPYLAKQGIARINLSSYDRIANNPHTVTFVEVVFKSGTALTWQKALDLVGLPKEGVVAVEQANPTGNYVLLEGMMIKDVLMAPLDNEPVALGKEPVKRFDKGFGVTWYEKPGDGPVLTIAYGPSLFAPITLSPWTLRAFDGAENKLEMLPDGAAQFTIIKVGTSEWGNSASVNADLKEQNDSGYRITFEAKADTPRSIWVVAELNDNPPSFLGLREKVALSTEYQKFTFHFLSKPFSNKSVRLPIIYFGDKTGIVTIRNVSAGERVH